MFLVSVPTFIMYPCVSLHFVNVCKDKQSIWTHWRNFIIIVILILHNILTAAQINITINHFTIWIEMNLKVYNVLAALFKLVYYILFPPFNCVSLS